MGYARVPQRHNKQIAFLAALAKGLSPVEAARIVGLPWSTFYTWRRKHTRFRKAWDEARAYGATPAFPPPSDLARMDLDLVREDRPVEVEFRDAAVHDMLVSLGDTPKPLPKNFIVVNVPTWEWPKLEAWVNGIADPVLREAARRRWLSRPPVTELRITELPPERRRRPRT